jgi:PilZ domain
LNKVIPMPGRSNALSSRLPGVRDRRYTIRYPFAADVELIDLESGKLVEGVTSDLSLGGCFICTSKPLPLNSRARMKLKRKTQVLEAVVVIRIVKPKVGMGIEFFDLESPNNDVLVNWIEALRRAR